MSISITLHSNLLVNIYLESEQGSSTEKKIKEGGGFEIKAYLWLV